MQRLELDSNIALTCVTTDRFKTNMLTAFLIRPLIKAEASLNALIPQVLCRGNTKQPNITAMSTRLAELYGAGLAGEVRKRGEHHCFGLASDFVGAENLEGAAELLFDTLLDPVFSDEYVASERDNLLSKLRALKNNKATYASMRHNALAFPDEPYSVSRLGDEDTVSAITPETLKGYYRKALETSGIELFYCGPATPDTVINLIRSYLNFNVKVPATKKTSFPIIENQQHFDEFQSMSQAQISLIWRTSITADNPDFFPASVACSLYGGSTTSKLFNNLRERLSLCYTTHSLLDRHKGIMKAQSGVEPSNLDRAMNEMLTQWNDVVVGNVSDEELDAAKSVLINELKSAGDSPAALESFWQGQAVCQLPDNLLYWISAIMNVTKKDVIRVANSFSFDSSYCLRAKQ